MIFASDDEFETAKEQLKDELKTHIAKVVHKISDECSNEWAYVWVFLLDSTEPVFLKFTKGQKPEWCNKMSFLFETAFDSVVRVLYETNNTINIRALNIFIDDFFNKHDLFDDEYWFLCSKCFGLKAFWDDETNTCVQCAVC